MARGWESKAVESQIETSQLGRTGAGKKRVTAEAAAAVRQKETIRLGIAHLQEQMKASRHPRHREMLQRALEDMEKQLTALDAVDGLQER